MKPLIILTGPTAVGKTELSLSLAKRIGAEIISADSMQVYKKMDIGTAKIRPEQMQGIPHHLIDIFMPDEEFHVVRFQQCAKACIAEIYARGKIPLLVGGTGFYIQALLKDVAFSEKDGDKSYRLELEKIAREKGAHTLHQMLFQVDKEAAEQIHPNNVKRVIRALEFHRETGRKISVHNKEESGKKPPYRFCYFVLELPRPILYERINRRVEQMMEEGLLKEVEGLLAEGYGRELVSMQGLGYKELAGYLQGEYSLEEAVELIKKNTRHFAKRQCTWFHRERDVIPVPKQAYKNEDEILAFMLKELQKKGIIQ